jgi:toxin ParE1/3/4
MKSVRLALLAEADLDDIWLYVAQRSSTGTADRLIDSITDRFGKLARMPAMGRLREDFGPKLRSFALEEYVIYYREMKPQGIEISRILHGRREQLSLLENEDGTPPRRKTSHDR